MEKNHRLTITFSIIFLFTAYIVVNIYFGPVAALIVGSIITIYIMYSVYTYSKDIMRADTSTRAGRVLKQQDNLVTYIFFIAIFFVYYSIIKELSDNQALSVILAGLLIYGTYKLAYHRAGLYERMRMQRKKRRDDRFVRSITPNLTKCLSCFEPIEDQFCAKCGFDNAQ